MIKKFQDMKSRVKLALGKFHTEKRATGGGPPPNKPCFDEAEAIIETLLSSVNTQGFADVAETDAVLVTPDVLHAPEYGSAIVWRI